jgi:hypothetical protein
VDRWEQRACADPERVAAHWPAGANIGIACGPSGLAVLDLDTHEPLPREWQLPGLHDGKDVLAQLCEWAEQPWPTTHMVKTPTDGWHLYFLAPKGVTIRNSQRGIGPSVDVRGGGGYVLAAGSIVDERAYDDPGLAARVRDGRAYEELDGDPPAPLPAWLCRMLSPSPRPHPSPSPGPRSSPSGRLAGLAGTVRAGKPGDRTGPLVWAAHRLAEMIATGEASPDDGDLLVQAAVDAEIRGGERYARYQVQHVLGGAR